MLSEIPDDEFAAAIDSCAAEVLWEADVHEPPVDAIAVAERLHLVVTHDLAMPCRGRFVRLAESERPSESIGTIVVGGSPNVRSVSIGPWPTKLVRAWRTAFLSG